MTCAGCGRTNRDESRFCVACGQSLAPGCPACGREAEAEARFCGGCGAALATPPGARAATHPPEDAVARKVVTIVFLSVFMTTGDCIRSAIPFDLTDADRALARFAELSGD